MCTTYFYLVQTIHHASVFSVLSDMECQPQIVHRSPRLALTALPVEIVRLILELALIETPSSHCRDEIAIISSVCRLFRDIIRSFPFFLGYASLVKMVKSATAHVVRINNTLVATCTAKIRITENNTFALASCCADVVKCGTSNCSVVLQILIFSEAALFSFLNHFSFWFFPHSGRLYLRRISLHLEWLKEQRLSPIAVSLMKSLEARLQDLSVFSNEFILSPHSCSSCLRVSPVPATCVLCGTHFDCWNCDLQYSCMCGSPNCPGVCWEHKWNLPLCLRCDLYWAPNCPSHSQRNCTAFMHQTMQEVCHLEPSLLV